VTFACATAAEERAARRAGFSTARVGLGARRELPAGELVSFGLAGSLDGLDRGTVIDAVRVVDDTGTTLWEGEGLGVAGAVRGTILAAARIVASRSTGGAARTRSTSRAASSRGADASADACASSATRRPGRSAPSPAP
jgi:hypothetical protein